MERDTAEKEMDDEEVCNSNLASEAREANEYMQDDRTSHPTSQETPNLVTEQDSEGDEEAEDYESTEAKEDLEEVLDESEPDKSEDYENAQVINQEEDEAAKEQHMNGESGWRSIGSGKRCKLKSGGSLFEQKGQSAFSSFQRGTVMSGGSRHKQTRRRNHHHHLQNRGRRRTGNQLFLAFKEMLSESLSFWCISCVHMLIEIIVTLTHNCGVGVETGVVKVYSFGQQLLMKITDVPGMKADVSRVLKWIKSTGSDFVDRTARFMNWVKSAVLTCFGLFYALAILSFQWTKRMVVRIGGERGKRYWTVFQESRFWKRLLSLLDGVRRWFRRRAHTPPFSPESPGRAGRGEPVQELERLLALVEVPEGELDPFTVLGVEVHATETELKKAYRQLAVQVRSGWERIRRTAYLFFVLGIKKGICFCILLQQPFFSSVLFKVHPDKNKHPRAGEAFKVLRAAWDIVSNPETRREYEL